MDRLNYGQSDYASDVSPDYKQADIMLSSPVPSKINLIANPTPYLESTSNNQSQIKITNDQDQI